MIMSTMAKMIFIISVVIVIAMNASAIVNFFFFPHGS